MTDLLNPGYSRKLISLQLSFCSAPYSSKKKDIWKEIYEFPAFLNIIATMILRKHTGTHLDLSWKSCIPI